MQWGALQEFGACTKRERRSPEVDSSRPTRAPSPLPQCGTAALTLLCQGNLSHTAPTS